MSLCSGARCAYRIVIGIWLKFRRGNSGVAKVAIARKLAVRLYWKLLEAAPEWWRAVRGVKGLTINARFAERP
jgi:hypothetical protein